MRQALWAKGLRYRKNRRDLPGKPDLVFPGKRVAVFCDGNFWHGHNWQERKEKLGQGHNPEYWIAKIEGNMARDLRNQAQLEALGWTVLRFWESDIKARLDEVVSQISIALGT